MNINLHNVSDIAVDKLVKIGGGKTRTSYYRTISFKVEGQVISFTLFSEEASGLMLRPKDPPKPKVIALPDYPLPTAGMVPV